MKIFNRRRRVLNGVGDKVMRFVCSSYLSVSNIERCDENIFEDKADCNEVSRGLS
jgi:hypothetical protein